MPLSRLNFNAIASRKSWYPFTGVYLVKFASSAAFAASLMNSGVAKSGSPKLRLMISSPLAVSSLLFLAIASVADSVRLVIRAESRFIRYKYICFADHHEENERKTVALSGHHVHFPLV